MKALPTSHFSKEKSRIFSFMPTIPCTNPSAWLAVRLETDTEPQRDPAGESNWERSNMQSRNSALLHLNKPFPIKEPQQSSHVQRTTPWHYGQKWKQTCSCVQDWAKTLISITFNSALQLNWIFNPGGCRDNNLPYYNQQLFQPFITGGGGTTTNV